MGPADIIFYAVFATLGVSFIAVTEGMGNRIASYYGVLLTGMLALIFLVEGVGVELFGWDEGFNLWASYVFGNCYSAYGFWLAYIGSGGEAGRRWARPALIAALTTCAVTLILILPPFSQRPSIFLDLLIIIMIVANLGAALTWKTTDGSINRVAFQVLAAATFFCVAGFAGIVFDVWDVHADVWFIRIPFAAIALMTIGTVTFALIDIRRSHSLALEEKLAATEREAAQLQERYKLEKAYSEAQAAVIEQSRLLSEVSHDIRQPIASLRAEVDASLLPEEARGRLRQLADHLYELSDGYVQHPVGSALPKKEGPHTLSETIQLSDFFATVRLLFEGDAAAAGVELRVIDSSLDVLAPATPLMRIVSNLATNALTHAKASRLLVGAKKEGGRVLIIVADDGEGLSAEELEQAYQRGKKNEETGGNGLGLSIVRLLSEEHDLPIESRTIPGVGCLFGLSVPLALQQPAGSAAE